MQPIIREVNQFVGPTITYVIPPFQRQYQWTEDQQYFLVRDIADIAQNPFTSTGQERNHWIGIHLVNRAEGHPLDPGEQRWDLVDGQQRLITILLWLRALHDHANETYGGNEKDRAHKLSNVIVQDADKESFADAMSGRWRDLYRLGQEPTGPLRGYVYFRWLLWIGPAALEQPDPPALPKIEQKAKVRADGTHEPVELLWAKHWALQTSGPGPEGTSKEWLVRLRESTLHKMLWLQIQRQDGDEPAATMFGTLNGTGLRLRPWDHVRNALFVQLPRELVKTIFENQWKPAEEVLQRARWNGKRSDAPSIFLYDFLIARGEQGRQGPLNRNKGDEHFRRMISALSGSELAALVSDDLVPLMHYWTSIVTTADRISLPKGYLKPSDSAYQLVRSIRTFSSGPLDPAILFCFDLFRRKLISDKELQERLNNLESFVARFTLLNRPMNNLRASFMAMLGKLAMSESQGAWTKLLQESGWPDDDEVLDGVEGRSLYGEASSAQLMALFRGIERSLSGPAAHKMPAGKDEDCYGIEHILPQSRKQEHWRVALGDEYPDAMELVDTLGNLCPLTNKHNKKVGTKLIADKQQCLVDDKPLGYKEPPLKVHNSWSEEKHWGVKQIKHRSKYLTDAALRHWPR